MRIFYDELEVTNFVGTAAATHEIRISNEVFGRDPAVGKFKFLRLVEHEQTFVAGGEGDSARLQMCWRSGPSMSSQLAPLDDYISLGKGLEIGGPSCAMEPLGIYTKPASLDNANFASCTIWNSTVAGAPYASGLKTEGRQFVCDVVDLPDLHRTYDFVFASHVLEHLLNPLRAICAMRDTLRPGGYVILVLPWKQGSFDHRRPTTSFEELHDHLRKDLREDDNAAACDHLTDALLSQYDFQRDPGAKDPDFLRQRTSKHATNRALHVHVFDFDLLHTCLEFCQLEPIYAQLACNMHQVVIGRKRHNCSASGTVNGIPPTPRSPLSLPRCLVLYTTNVLNERARFFLRYGVFDSPQYAFMLILNGCPAPRLQPRFLRIVSRSNVGFDFGAWGEALNLVPLDSFSHFVFLNNSTLGPFVENQEPWPTRLLALLEQTDVRLAGVTTDFSGMTQDLITPHVQSFVLAMPNETMHWLRDAKIFPAQKEDLLTDFRRVAECCELGASKIVLSKGFNLACLMPFAQHRDFRDLEAGPRWSHTFNHTTPASIFKNKEEALFVKANRNATLDWIFRWPQYFHDYPLTSVRFKGKDFPIQDKLCQNSDWWVSVEAGFELNGVAVREQTLLIFRNFPPRVRLIPQFV